jgi:hypothetical protein
VPRLLGEDVAFLWRAARAGFRVECLVDAIVDHDGTVTSLAAYFDRPNPIPSSPGEPDVYPAP